MSEKTDTADFLFLQRHQMSLRFLPLQFTGKTAKKCISKKKIVINAQNLKQNIIKK